MTPLVDELAEALRELLAFAVDVTTGVHAIEIDPAERQALIEPAQSALSRYTSEQGRETK